MNFSESFKQAFDSLKAISFGLFTYNARHCHGSILSHYHYGHRLGCVSYMNSQFEKIGANTISVTYNQGTLSQQDWLTLEDMDTVRKAARGDQKHCHGYSEDGLLRRTARQGMRLLWEYLRSTRALISLKWRRVGLSMILMSLHAPRWSLLISSSFRSILGMLRMLLARQYVLEPGGNSTNLKIVGVKKSGDDLFGSVMNSDIVPAIIYMPVTTVQSMYSSGKRLEAYRCRWWTRRN